MTPKQQRFVAEYLIDFNATQAAVRAGFSAKTAQQQGSRMLLNVVVANAIKAAQEKLSAKFEVKAEDVIRELAHIGFSNMRDFTAFGPDGVTLRDMSEMSEAATRCIAEVSQTTTVGGGSVKFKLHDKKGALDSLARHLGLFNDKLEVTGNHEDFLEMMLARKEDAGHGTRH